MIPTSAGCALATVGALMSGRIPVMINYSTGARAMQSMHRKNANSKQLLLQGHCLKKSNVRLLKAW